MVADLSSIKAKPRVVAFRVVEVGLFLLFAGYRIAEAAQPPAIWQDSEAYHAVAANGWFTGALWVGERAPLVPVFIKLCGGSYVSFAVVQGSLGAAAWGFLAWTAGRFVELGWRRLFVVAPILGFGAAPLVAGWDWSVLSESLSLSVLAVLCAFGLWLIRSFTWVRLGAVAVSALAYVGLRDADTFDVGLVGLVLIVVAVVSIVSAAYQRRSSPTAPPILRTEPKIGGNCAFLLIGGIFILASLLGGIGAGVSHRNVTNTEDVFFVRVFPFSTRVTWFATHGMPQAPAVDALARSQPPSRGDSAQIVAPALNDPQWNSLRAWFQHEGFQTYVLYLATHPLYDATAPFHSPDLTYNDFSGHLADYDPSGRAIGLLESVLVPNRFVVAGFAFLGMAIVALRRGLGRWPLWIYLAGWSVLGVIAMLFALAGFWPRGDAAHGGRNGPDKTRGLTPSYIFYVADSQGTTNSVGINEERSSEERGIQDRSGNPVAKIGEWRTYREHFASRLNESRAGVSLVVVRRRPSLTLPVAISQVGRLPRNGRLGRS